MSELRPCPFCGGKSEVMVIEPFYEFFNFWVSCTALTCRAQGPLRQNNTAAIAAWNRREPDWQAKWEGLVEDVSRRTDQAKGMK
jgi:Lar family restriction alleviation protein